MPCELQIDPSRRVVFSIYKGCVSVTDVLNQRLAISSNRDFDPSFAHILDLSGTTTIEMKADDIRKIAKTPTPFHPTARKVFVAPTDHLFGLARMYQLIGEETHPGTTVVKSRQEAEALLQNT